MNSKKTFITLGIVVAVLALGIAYAAITAQTLTVNGNVVAVADANNFDVNFTGTPATSGTVTAVVTSDAKVATMDVSGLTTEGQKATASFQVVNESSADITASLGANVVYDNTEWFSVTAVPAATSLAKGGNTTLDVTVELLKTPATAEDESAAQDTFTITLTASPVSK